MVDQIYNSDWYKIAEVIGVIAAILTFGLALSRRIVGWLWRKHLQFFVASINKRMAINAAKNLSIQFNLVKSLRQDQAKLELYLHTSLIDMITSTIIVAMMAVFSILKFWNEDPSSASYVVIIATVFLIFIWKPESRVHFGIRNFEDYEAQTMGNMTRLIYPICDHDIASAEQLIADLLEDAKNVQKLPQA